MRISGFTDSNTPVSQAWHSCSEVTETLNKESRVVVKQPTVLIVDDDPDCRLILETLFTHNGYDCVEAENGAVALALLQKMTIDLIITDYQMPMMNGCEFLEELARMEDEHPPTVMITGNCMERVWKRAIGAGAKAVLSKPYEHKTILSVVWENLQYAREAREMLSKKGR